MRSLIALSLMGLVISSPSLAGGPCSEIEYSSQMRKIPRYTPVMFVIEVPVKDADVRAVAKKAIVLLAINGKYSISRSAVGAHVESVHQCAFRTDKLLVQVRAHVDDLTRLSDAYVLKVGIRLPNDLVKRRPHVDTKIDEALLTGSWGKTTISWSERVTYKKGKRRLWKLIKRSREVIQLTLRAK